MWKEDREEEKRPISGRTLVSAWSHWELRNVSYTLEFVLGGIRTGFHSPVPLGLSPRAVLREKLQEASRSLSVQVNGFSNPRAILWKKSNMCAVRTKLPETGNGRTEMGKGSEGIWVGCHSMSCAASNGRHLLPRPGKVKPERMAWDTVAKQSEF